MTGWVITVDITGALRPPANCYIGGVLPTLPPLTNRTLRLESVLFEAATSALLFETYDTPQQLRLGDSPNYRWPIAISGGVRSGSMTSFTGAEQFRSYGPSPRTSIESRQFSTAVTFVRNGAQASGTITISAQYSCVDNGATSTAQCPRAPPFAMDAASCSVTMPFTAQQQAQVPLWPRASVPLVGVPQYGAFITADFVNDPTCYGNQQIPVQQWLETNQPRYHAIQPVTLPSGPALEFTRPFTVRLGDAPEVTVMDPLPASGANTFARTLTWNGMGPWQYGKTANETRSWTVTFPFAPTNGLHQGPMTVRSQYTCMDSGTQPSQRCPLGTLTDPFGPDPGTCQRSLPVQAFQLP